MPTNEHGSLTKEFPLNEFERTIGAITPGMTFQELRVYATAHSQSAIPGLLANRFLLLDDGRIVFDRLLTAIQQEGQFSPRLRKAMFFLWCWRDDRLRRYICDQVADDAGHWRASILLDKRRAAFFEQFFQSGPAAKARSNLEEHLARAGILDREKKTIDMDLADGWLPLAIEIVAQHERNPTDRMRLLADPVAFLADERLHALASATLSEVQVALEGLPILGDPVEDEQLGTAPTGAVSPSKKWVSRSINAKTAKQATISRDEIKVERASRAHLALEEMLAALLTDAGFTAECNDSIDMFAKAKGGALLAEIKSCTELNQLAQVRKGVAQLLEYRFIYGNVLGHPIHPVLVLETPPHPARPWLVPYLNSIGISVAWRDSDRLVCPGGLKAPFNKVMDGDTP